MIYLETLINGVLLGGLYGILGLGLALVFGVMRVINVAHGEFIVAAAILAASLLNILPGINPLLMLIPVALIAFAVGYLFQLLLLNRVVRRGDMLAPMLVTFGVSIIIKNLMLAVFGSNPMAIDAGPLAKASFTLGGLHIGILPVITLAISIALFAFLRTLVSATTFGKTLRATADNPEIVRLMGVNPMRIYAVVMGIAFVMAAVAGVLLAMRTSFSASSGTDRILIAFEVVVLGGLGSFWGALVAGILLGVVQLMSFQFDANSGLLYAHLMFFFFLIMRPSGLLGAKS
ncbi:branched-chain amino acid ABC transporter permease [Rhizobium paknamense]|uniref:Branched-chain amino acid transport system permease protein n=1 Tax=Rhizobium paknamense TaxID=1206817 RepID=A0ABU0IF13_9HYPH|nr:branched-chain amino acid ABC transporter permease [Rhizobium paknamense]MDQ0456810.1 branched-chain amino acid transport system permease protein [Rhizobium paknamense]